MAAAAAEPRELVGPGRKAFRPGPPGGGRAAVVLGSRAQINASSPGSLKGRARNSTAFATLKIATLLPMPSASVSRMTPVKSGRPAKERSAYLRSRSTSRVMARPPESKIARGGGGGHATATASAGEAGRTQLASYAKGRSEENRRAAGASAGPGA